MHYQYALVLCKTKGVDRHNAIVYYFIVKYLFAVCEELSS